MLPPEARAEGGVASAAWDPERVPQGVEDVCEELRQEPGIDAVTLGRQVQERRTVSQARARVSSTPPVVVCDGLLLDLWSPTDPS